MNRYLQLPLYEAGLVLEGGSIDVNGLGSLLTTEQCLLNPNRNPRVSRSEIEEKLGEWLGATHVLWLGEGIAGDDTDGHVDDIARFVDSRTVVCVVEDDPADENYRPLKDNYERLVRSRDQSGELLEVVKLPMPGYVASATGRLPASYANFYIGNRAVVAPIFGTSQDGRALEILQRCFPGRRVLGVDCRRMAVGLGTIHCCSQQQPRARRSPTPRGIVSV
jgi:agmatine deiminase